nr:hypothetical protein [Veillonella sp.]
MEEAPIAIILTILAVGLTLAPLPITIPSSAKELVVAPLPNAILFKPCAFAVEPRAVEYCPLAAELYPNAVAFSAVALALCPIAVVKPKVACELLPTAVAEPPVTFALPPTATEFDCVATEPVPMATPLPVPAALSTANTDCPPQKPPVTASTVPITAKRLPTLNLFFIHFLLIHQNNFYTYFFNKHMITIEIYCNRLIDSFVNTSQKQ